MTLPKIKRHDATQEAKPAAEPQEKPASLKEITVEVVAVTVPYVSTPDPGYQSRRCDLGRLTQEQSRKLNAIRRGYDYGGKRLANGGDVKSLADAVRALIDSVEI
jgi:hypothetical protein